MRVHGLLAPTRPAPPSLWPCALSRRRQPGPSDDLSRAQQVILEDAAQTVIIRQALDDWITRNPCW
jgi:hypothetical protein